MSVTVYTDSTSFIQALYDLEFAETKGPVRLVSSYLSSVYFPPSFIERYYASSSTDPGDSAKVLIKRQKLALERLSTIPRREIYEAEAFTKLLSQGIVHEQETSFRIRPIDLQNTFNNLIHLLGTFPTYEIAITSQVIPMVYLLTPPDKILIDIRANYTYQKIQGQLIEGETDAYKGYADEFESLWNSPLTISAQDKVRSLLTKSINLWDRGENIDLAFWPTMQKTQRDS